MGVAAQALNPATLDAAVLSHSVPLLMAPGERLDVGVRMINVGSTPEDGWNTTDHRLRNNSTDWRTFGFRTVPLPSPVAPGESTAIPFVLTAPITGGTHEFRAQMMQLGSLGGLFGEELRVHGVLVDPGVTPRWACTLVSSELPTTMYANERRSVNVTVKNAGTATWQAGEVCLRALDDPAFPAVSCSPMTIAAGPGEEVSLVTELIAPATPGVYTVRRQLFDSGGPGRAAIGLFSSASCIEHPLTVTGSHLDAAIVSEDFPSTMIPGQIQTVSVRVRNIGPATWRSTDGIGLYSQNSPASLFGVTRTRLTQDVAPGAEVTLALAIRAPTLPGSYRHRWQMRKTLAPGGFFGPLIDVCVTVAHTLATFSYTDTLAADQGGPELAAFFVGLGSIASGSYMAFQVVTDEGAKAWCAGNAAEMVRDYLASADTFGDAEYAGSELWTRVDGGAWVPFAGARPNYFGDECFGPYSWCTNWGLQEGTLYLAHVPSAEGGLEVYDDGFALGSTLTLRVGSDRTGVCGF